MSLDEKGIWMALLTATDLHEWSNRLDAQAHLPTLVRRLIMATIAPSSIRIAAAEGIRFPGFDGVVETSEGAPPFVPAGRSVWELGTGGSPRSKAERDYKKRTEATPAAERARTTFVFVTSREWEGAREWARGKAEGHDGWAGVVALDAQDLATWLETCPGVTNWLATEHLGRQPSGVSALRDWFLDWSERTEPPIPAPLLLAGRNTASTDLLTHLRGPAGERPVATRSREEAVAFVAAALLTPAPDEASEGTDQVRTPISATDDAASLEPLSREALLERVLVIHDAAAWRRWMIHERPLILVPLFEDPPIDAAVQAGHHVLLPQIARPGDKALPPLSRNAATAAWENAGMPFPRADNLARSARRSLASLRRTIGRDGRFRQPRWAEGTSANLLAALLLAGAWGDDVEGDKDVVRSLADRGWRSLARDLAPLKMGEDAPLVARGHQWEFVDIVDAWDALSPTLTSEDLVIFNEQILQVLTEEDPGLELTPEESQRQRLSLDGPPRRTYSSLLRRGMANTVALLGAVAGDQALAGGRTGERLAAAIVRSLLLDADDVRWRSLADLLPILAEAAPDAFLDAIEASIRQADPPIMKLFDEQPDALGLFSSSRHVSLLWALEGLALSTRHVSRVAVVLARLADLEPGGRLTSRPAESLKTILHVVIPQSAVDQEARLQIIDAVRQAAPSVAWKLMLSLVSSTRTGGMLSRGPRFRDWPLPPDTGSYAEVTTALDALADRIAADAGDDDERWPAALELIDELPLAGRERLLAATDEAWPGLNQEIQRHILDSLDERVSRHSRFRDAQWALDEGSLQPLRQFVEEHRVPGLSPGDSDLFRWFPRRGSFDIRTEEGRAALADSRADAARRAVSEDGISNLRHLAGQAERPETVGQALALVTDDLDDQVLALLGHEGADHLFAAGLAQARGAADPSWLRRAVAEHPQIAVPLLLTGVVDESLLSEVNDLPEDDQAAFWARLPLFQIADSVFETVVSGLLDHDRPYSAIELLEFRSDATPLPVELAVRALQAPTHGTAEKPDLVSSPQYIIEQLMNKVESAGVQADVLARLEWFYLPLLEHSRAPRALHEQLATDPSFFAEMVAVIYKPDPPASAAESAESADDATTPANDPRVVAAAWGLLHNWRSPIPGSSDQTQPTTEGLQAWVSAAKQALGEARRTRVASTVIGEAMSGPTSDPDGTWPSIAVRTVLEHEQDIEMEQGIAIGRANQRGVTTRGAYEGGDQERALAAQYRQWADKVRGNWPRSGVVLDALSDDYEAEARHNDALAEKNSEL